MLKKSIIWAKEIETTNDYLNNINIIALDEFTSYKNMGFAASIVSSFTRHIEKEIEKEMKATSKKQELISNYIGTIGEKIQTELTYINSFSFETQWGSGHIHKFLDTEGNVFIWKSSNPVRVDQGQLVKIKGTIKDHAEYAGAKQTVLTRCKIA